MSQRKFSSARVVLLGAPGVGKTAFAVRYITKRFIGDYDTNKEMLYTHKVAGARDEVTLEILDTAAKGGGPEEELEALRRHIRWADGVVAIYSVTDRVSLQWLGRLATEMAAHGRQGSETPLVLVANKCDLLTARAVTEEEGEQLAGELGCPRLEVSVAEGAAKVQEAMEELLCQLRREHVKSLTSAQVGASLEKRSRLYNMKKAFKKRVVRSKSDTF